MKTEIVSQLLHSGLFQLVKSEVPEEKETRVNYSLVLSTVKELPIWERQWRSKHTFSCDSADCQFTLSDMLMGLKSMQKTICLLFIHPIMRVPEIKGLQKCVAN